MEGGCLPACASNSDCPGGVGCDTTLGICVQAAKSCTITNDCGSATQVCVGGDCVPRSAGGACSAGLVWNENGCVPPQAKLSACSTEGVRGTCAAGSICLQGSCWISCDAPNQNACASQATLNTCKPISSAGATYNVCATAKSLGSQCNPPADVECAAGSACLDGFCK